MWTFLFIHSSQVPQPYPASLVAHVLLPRLALPQPDGGGHHRGQEHHEGQLRILERRMDNLTISIFQSLLFVGIFLKVLPKFLEEELTEEEIEEEDEADFGVCQG